MKRIFILIFSILGLYSCRWPDEFYYDPIFDENTEKQEKISCLGEVRCFEADFECVMTKFEFIHTDYFKPFKYVVEIEGIELSEAKIIKNNNDLWTLSNQLSDKFPSFYQNLPTGNGLYRIAFQIPINLSETERKVEVKLCVANEYDSIDNWGDWNTVFSAVQEAFTLPEQKFKGKITVDHEYIAVGQDSTNVYKLLANDPLFTGRTYCKFVEDPSGSFGLELYDTEGALVDKGSIDHLGNICEVFPEVYDSMLPASEIVSRLEWNIDFTNNGSRKFHVLVVYGEKLSGIFGEPYEIYLYEDLSSEYTAEHDIDLAVRKHRLHFLTPMEIEEIETLERDDILLDGYTLLFGEYTITGIPGYDEIMPEHLVESALAHIENERLLHDYTRLTLNKDRTYSMTEHGETISSGTYKIGIYPWDIQETMCYYYPGSCSKLGYLTLTDKNGDEEGYDMQISVHPDQSKEYGVPWLYQYIEIIDGNLFYHAGIRYGLTLQE